MDYSQEIIGLENANLYKEAALRSYEIWEGSNTLKSLLCAALEMWLVIIYDHRFGLSLLNDNEIMERWRIITKELQKSWDSDSELMFYSGYMMHVSFYLFNDLFDDPEGDCTSNNGLLMMDKAYQQDPSDPVYLIQHIRNHSKRIGMERRRCNKVYLSNKTEIDLRFSGGGMVNEYFRHIFVCIRDR